MFASLAAHRTVEWSLVESNTLCTVEVFLTRDWASLKWILEIKYLKNLYAIINKEIVTFSKLKSLSPWVLLLI